MRIESRIGHACKMLRRNLRSYLMLSITLVFSFGVLLAYFAFSDSNSYNAYKEIMSSPREIVMAYSRNESFEELQILNKQVMEQIPGTSSYLYPVIGTTLSQYGNIHTEISILPNHASMVFRDISDETVFENYTSLVEVIQGQGFPLKEDQAIINESLYRSLSPEGALPMPLQIPFLTTDGTYIIRQVQVVGVCKDIGETPLSYDAEGNLQGYAHVYVSQSLLEESDIHRIVQRKPMILFHSPNPETVAAYAKHFDVVLHAVCIAQDAATGLLHMQAKDKLLIALVLYCLLSLNLYGCFSNALSDRRYEIGIKRALGASKITIVFQFFVEGLLVMLGSILISVLSISAIVALYKLYQLIVIGGQWIFYVSPHSLLMFAICSVGMSLFLSLLFAFRATQTEISNQLKSE